MKRVRVEVPFHMKATNNDYVRGDILEVDEETLARIQAVNINLVSVLCDVEAAEETPKKRKPRKPKE